MVEWRRVVGFDKYEVSEDGRVRRIVAEDKYFELKPTKNSAGYLRANLSQGGQRKMKKINVLMLESFIGLRPFPNAHSRHLDGDKTNNVLSNLAWGTAQDNVDDRERIGRGAKGERNGRAKLTLEQVEYVLSFAPPTHGMQSKLARELGVGVGAIHNIMRSKMWINRLNERAEERGIARRSYGF